MTIEPSALHVARIIERVAQYDTPSDADPRRRFTLAQMEMAVRAALSAALPQPVGVAGDSKHICGLAEMGSYAGQVILAPPDWLREMWPTGIGIDVCLALEIQWLWGKGIKTNGHCCGHGRAHAYIGVEPESIESMLALGYNPIDDRGHFVPKTLSGTAKGSPLLSDPNNCVTTSPDGREAEESPSLATTAAQPSAVAVKADWYAKFNKHGECVALRKTHEEAESDEGMWPGDTIVPLSLSTLAPSAAPHKCNCRDADADRNCTCAPSAEAAKPVADTIFDIIWPQCEWNDEQFCREVAAKVARALSHSQGELREGMVLVPRRLLETTEFWLTGALECASWTWDPYQHDAANHTAEELRAALAGRAAG